MTKTEILDYLKNHKNELRERFGVITIGLFGSYARDEQTDDSDIDLAIEMEKNKKNLSAFFSLKRKLEGDLQKKVDIGIESTLKPIVKEHINKEIIYV
jgi:predicted nucleotidyltransferase